MQPPPHQCSCHVPSLPCTSWRICWGPAPRTCRWQWEGPGRQVRQQLQRAAHGAFTGCKPPVPALWGPCDPLLTGGPWTPEESLQKEASKLVGLLFSPGTHFPHGGHHFGWFLVNNGGREMQLLGSLIILHLTGSRKAVWWFPSVISVKKKCVNKGKILRGQCHEISII